jgi:hypothetical protein
MAPIADLEEKKAGVVVEEENISISSAEQKREIDGAGQFLQEHKDIDISGVDINKLRHKIDLHVISCLCAVFIMTFLDKAIYNVSLHEPNTELRLYN